MLVQTQPSVGALSGDQTCLGSNQGTLSTNSSSSSWVQLRSVLFIISSSSLPISSHRGSPKSPWSRRRSKHSLLAKQWKELFDAEGKLSDGGAKFLKKIRTGGIEPSLRSEAWPFLLGMYDMNSSEKERQAIRAGKRREYSELCRQCHQISSNEGSFKPNEILVGNASDDSGDDCQVLDPLDLVPVSSPTPSASTEVSSLSGELNNKFKRNACLPSSRESSELKGTDGVTSGYNVSESDTESLDSDSSDDPDYENSQSGSMANGENHHYEPFEATPEKFEAHNASCRSDDFPTWRKIIRLDAIRVDTEWITYSPSQASISAERAHHLAESVGLKDCDHLEPSSIHHAARIVAILEAYALYDPETSYCQGMSDLLSPIISVIEEDDIAFWCFVGFMRKARHNFRLDEIGIKRQLSIVSKIIKCKDTRLNKHLEKLEAEDCFFVYRMVVVLFRRELSFEQTLPLGSDVGGSSRDQEWLGQVVVEENANGSASNGRSSALRRSSECAAEEEDDH